MASATSAYRAPVSVTVFYCLCMVFCVIASPTRRQFVTYTETTSSDPAALVTNDGTVWDDSDDFVLADDWLSHASPSPTTDNDEYEYDAEEQDPHQEGVLLDHGGVPMPYDDDDEDDSAEAQNRHDSEFLFVPSRDNRLLLEDDDGPIKVRHTGKNSYSRVATDDDSEEDKDQQFEFTVDDENQSEEKVEDNDDSDFDLEEETPPKISVEENDTVEILPSQEIDDDDNEDDDEEEFENDLDGDDEMFENPDEDAAQVIYGDHVFLY
ncbi:mitotic apparatus protein p62-like [Uloborus diversus]|uniref:mitotic apparatus protein p62-like n=1 Tax=Uloborus diversus TaxID=327109 RepID=UPI002409DE31|nr:mitotic apparatus protein p62-like [Uloborus diversus]